MLNDLRARRFRSTTPTSTLCSTNWIRRWGCIEEVSRFGSSDWERAVTRLPAEHRTARWLIRHAAHEGMHHTADIARTT
jgi:hypothetical protein